MLRTLREVCEDGLFLGMLILIIAATPLLMIYGLGYACAAGLEAWRARRR